MATNRQSIASLCRLAEPGSKRSGAHNLPIWQSPEDWVAPVYNCSVRAVRSDPSDPQTGVVARGQHKHLKDWPCPAPNSKEMARKWGSGCGSGPSN